MKAACFTGLLAGPCFALIVVYGHWLIACAFLAVFLSALFCATVKEIR